MYGAYMHGVRVNAQGATEADEARMLRVAVGLDGVAAEVNGEPICLTDETYARIPYTQLTPVTLTGDLLLRMGFTKIPFHGHDCHFSYIKTSKVNKNSISVLALYDSDFSVMLHQRAQGIKFVHTLQGIAYLVLAEELTIDA